jgi:hypothetical protein
MNRIYVVDSIMGSGKTTYCHNEMLTNKDKKYIYITPYLEEIKRLIGDKDNRTGFYTDRLFREPLHLGEGKLQSLHELLIKEKNIVTTHALFRRSIPETIELISTSEYTLMLDEALDVIEIIDIACQDYDMLLNNKLIEEQEKGLIKWVDDKYEGKFIDLKILCQNGIVAKIKRSKKVQLLAWNFSSDLFKAFKEVYIFTYLFESSHLKYYFDMNNIKYEKYTIQNNKLIFYQDKNPYNKSDIRNLINIYNGNLNNLGDKETAMSLNWFKNYPNLRVKLKNNIYNYLHNILEAKSNTIIWTTFKSAKKSLSGSGYSRRFISLNTRATNKYKNSYNLAYCCNRYISPDYIDYFRINNILVNEDLYALSELLQWIWRSAIREGNQINIYIPSQRMRNILIDWLNDENV